MSTDSIAPRGTLAMQTIAMPKDTNANGDIFGGWLVSQMDLAAGILSKQVAQGRTVTVAIREVNFLLPVKVGSTVTCYAQLTRRGRSSMEFAIEVWISKFAAHDDLRKAAEGQFVFVAIDENGSPRPLPVDES